MNSAHTKNTLHIVEAPTRSDLFRYIKIVATEAPLDWIPWIIVMKIFCGKKCRLTVVKNNEKIIGGFFTGPSLAFYKYWYWLNKKIRTKIDELRADEYEYFSCFIIKNSHRNAGVGTFVFETYLKKRNAKLWFTSSKKAVNFYLRNGATVALDSVPTLYTFKK